jgi:hypothetical protein
LTSNAIARESFSEQKKNLTACRTRQFMDSVVSWSICMAKPKVLIRISHNHLTPKEGGALKLKSLFFALDNLVKTKKNAVFVGFRPGKDKE